MLRQSCLPNGGKDRLHHKYDRSYIHEKYSDLWHNLLHIGEFDLAKDGSVEGPWGTQPIDT